MANDFWNLALNRLRPVLEQWHEARVLAIPRNSDHRHGYIVNLLQLELSARNQIDDICRGWIAGKRLQIKRPSGTNADIADLLYDRFAEAYGFCNSCRAGNAPFVATSEAAVLTHALIDYWEGGGADAWRERVDE